MKKLSPVALFVCALWCASALGADKPYIVTDKTLPMPALHLSEKFMQSACVDAVQRSLENESGHGTQERIEPVFASSFLVNDTSFACLVGGDIVATTSTMTSAHRHAYSVSIRIGKKGIEKMHVEELSF